MKGSRYVVNSNVGGVSFLPFSVLSSEVMYLCTQNINVLAHGKGHRSDGKGVPGTVSQVFRHISLSLKAPTSLWFPFSFLSIPCFSFLFSCVS